MKSCACAMRHRARFCWHLPAAFLERALLTATLETQGVAAMALPLPLPPLGEWGDINVVTIDKVEEWWRLWCSVFVVTLDKWLNEGRLDGLMPKVMQDMDNRWHAKNIEIQKHDFSAISVFNKTYVRKSHKNRKRMRNLQNRSLMSPLERLRFCRSLSWVSRAMIFSWSGDFVPQFPLFKNRSYLFFAFLMIFSWVSSLMSLVWSIQFSWSLCI